MRKIGELIDNSRFSLLFLLLIGIFFSSPLVLAQGMIVDHNCTDNAKIPDIGISQVKALIKMHYAHTSHGGQLTTGIQRLANSSLPSYDARLTYALQYSSLSSSSDLCIMDGQLTDTYITPEEHWEDGGDSYI